jgi:hypothetical protein
VALSSALARQLRELTLSSEAPSNGFQSVVDGFFTTAAIALATSALDRIEDLRQTSGHVREVPTCDMASAHSITSSARASRVGGTVRPSAFAVLRLIMNSNFVGCSMGRSAGFAPVCTENLIRVDAVMESPKLAE